MVWTLWVGTHSSEGVTCADRMIRASLPRAPAQISSTYLCVMTSTIALATMEPTSPHSSGKSRTIRSRPAVQRSILTLSPPEHVGIQCRHSRSTRSSSRTCSHALSADAQCTSSRPSGTLYFAIRAATSDEVARVPDCPLMPILILSHHHVLYTTFLLGPHHHRAQYCHV